MPARPSGLLASPLGTSSAPTDTRAGAPGPFLADSDAPGHPDEACCWAGGGSLAGTLWEAWDKAPAHSPTVPEFPIGKQFSQEAKGTVPRAWRWVTATIPQLGGGRGGVGMKDVWDVSAVDPGEQDGACGSLGLLCSARCHSQRSLPRASALCQEAGQLLESGNTFQHPYSPFPLSSASLLSPCHSQGKFQNLFLKSHSCGDKVRGGPA